jgi:hypothetical protein
MLRFAGKTFLVALALWAAAPASARAADISRRVAIGAFKGPQAARLQDAVESALLRRYYLVPGSEVSEAARKSGVRLRSASEFAEVARRLKVLAFVSATVKKDREWKVEMVVRKGETGEAVGRYDWTDRRLEVLAQALARATPRRLRAVLASNDGTPAAADSQEPSEELEVKAKAPSLPEQAPDGEEAGPAEATPARPYLELGVGGKMFNRSMSYADNFSRLPGYTLGRATALAIDLAFHPFALASSSKDAWVAGLGLTAAFSYALDIGTELEGARRTSSQVFGYEIGLRQRFVLGSFDLVPHVGYLVDNFVSNGSEMAPDVRYQVVRTGLGARVALGDRFSLHASADFLHVLSAGPLTDASKFPRATAEGMDLGAGAGYALGSSLEADVSLGLRRYGWDMKVLPGDTLIAGGAIDQYLSVTVGLVYRPLLGRN